MAAKTAPGLMPQASVHLPDAYVDADERESRAIESLARLAADLGHDLNNQLSVILNYSFVLQRDSSRTAARSHLEEISAAAWRASRLVDALAALGWRRSTEADVIDLNTTVAGMAPLLQHLCQGCELRMCLSAEVPQVHAPRSQLELLIAALILHMTAQPDARDALIVETGRGRTGAPSLCVRLERSSFTREFDTTGGGHVRSGPRKSMGLGGYGSLRRAFKRTGARLQRGAGFVRVDLNSR